jgi:hypothetical protein
VYYVLDGSGAGARREITRKPPPQDRFFTKFRTTKKNSSLYIFLLKVALKKPSARLILVKTTVFSQRSS